MAGKEIGFGLVGTGMIARYHADAIAQTSGACLRAVCRSLSAGDDPERGARIAEAAARFGVPCEASYEALLAREDVDVVCICTPSGLHAAQAIAAAHAGKHALVEKPMALTVADADAMIAAFDGANRRLGIALQRRTDPVFGAVRTAIEEGQLGTLTLGVVTVPYYREQSYYESANWRGTWTLDGGGALMNQGIHLLDLLVWYLGEVAEVRANMAILAHRIEVEDCIVATLRFVSGALGSIAATTAAAPGFPHRVEIYGERGGVQMEGEGIARWEMHTPPPAEVVASLAAGRAVAGTGASPSGIAITGHLQLIGDMVGALREGRPPLVPGEEGRRSLAVAQAIYEAARTGQPVAPG
ncbi:MAG: Gfo/Idh/MocA family protein [Ktedonobacterales bacterium]